MKLPELRSAEVANKRVFLRLDLDVPFKDGQIHDDSRLLAGLPSLQFLLDNKSQVIIGGHLGRPQGQDQKLSLKPIADWLANEFRIQNSEFRIGDFDGWKFNENLYLLENLRFYPEEELNNEEFAKKLASLAEIYVNDAFAVSHRAHASIVGIPKFLPHFAGLQLIKEVEDLSKVLNNPNRPLVVIIGGAKIETKLPLVEKMLNFADSVLVGGEIATEIFNFEKPKTNLFVADLNEEKLDIASQSVRKFVNIINSALTIVWNGPMGKIEDPNFQNGTKELAMAISQTSAFTIVGGGDTIGFLKNLDLSNKFSFISTGGGAMLAYLSGERLPGISALS